MTQLLSLLSQIFAHHSTNRDLEQFIVSRNPSSRQQLERLIFGHRYQYATARRS
jgi:hypothetical protein